MAFDPDSYIRTLASAHGLAAKPGDADGSELTRRAVRAELADIKQRAEYLHRWSTVIITNHEARAEHPPAVSAHPRRRRDNTRGQHSQRGNA